MAAATPFIYVARKSKEEKPENGPMRDGDMKRESQEIRDETAGRRNNQTSIEAILRGDSSELAKLRDAVR